MNAPIRLAKMERPARISWEDFVVNVPQIGRAMFVMKM